ncbi:unnamed protein product, partial [Rotaria sp. Silwood2]
SSRRMSITLTGGSALAGGSLAKMTSHQNGNSETSPPDSYTQAIINRDESEQRKQYGTSGLFLSNDQKNAELTDEKDKTYEY